MTVYVLRRLLGIVPVLILVAMGSFLLIHLVPGDPANSRLIEVQSGQHFAQFSADELKLLSDWIQAGAPEK